MGRREGGRDALTRCSTRTTTTDVAAAAAGRTKASTLSLSVLVAIEMFNAFNALSEDNSLLQLPPWSNPWLLLATCISLGLHCVILYIPFLAQVRVAQHQLRQEGVGEG